MHNFNSPLKAGHTDRNYPSYLAGLNLAVRLEILLDVRLGGFVAEPEDDEVPDLLRDRATTTAATAAANFLVLTRAIYSTH